jgi:hypothetical protein
LEDEPVGTLPLSLLIHIQKSTNLAADIADGTLMDPEVIRRRFMEVEAGVLVSLRGVRHRANGSLTLAVTVGKNCEASIPPRMTSLARCVCNSIAS